MRRGWAILFAMLALFESAIAQTARIKPKVPPGIDPGGTAIGLITTGIDYTLPVVARCLARDGEGELIGWDVVDRDRLPYAMRALGDLDDSVLASAVNCDRRVKLVVTRVDPADAASLARAIAFFASASVQVIVLPVRSQPADWAPLRLAAERFNQLLITVAASEASLASDINTLPNVLVAPKLTAAGSFEESMMALARATHFTACAQITKVPATDLASIKTRFSAHLPLLLQLPIGHMLAPQCR